MDVLSVSKETQNDTLNSTNGEKRPHQYVCRQHMPPLRRISSQVSGRNYLFISPILSMRREYSRVWERDNCRDALMRSNPFPNPSQLGRIFHSSHPDHNPSSPRESRHNVSTIGGSLIKLSPQTCSICQKHHRLIGNTVEDPMSSSAVLEHGVEIFVRYIYGSVCVSLK